MVGIRVASHRAKAGQKWYKNIKEYTIYYSPHQEGAGPGWYIESWSMEATEKQYLAGDVPQGAKNKETTGTGTETLQENVELTRHLLL